MLTYEMPLRSWCSMIPQWQLPLIPGKCRK
jgi:hypothetical protein